MNVNESTKSASISPEALASNIVDKLVEQGLVKRRQSSDAIMSIKDQLDSQSLIGIKLQSKRCALTSVPKKKN